MRTEEFMEIHDRGNPAIGETMETDLGHIKDLPYQTSRREEAGDHASSLWTRVPGRSQTWLTH